MIHRFKPSIISKGNHFFQTTIEIDDQLGTVTLRRPKLIGSKIVTILVHNITTVALNTRTEYFYLCEITLLIRGGNVLSLNGFSPFEARRIREMVDEMKVY